MAANSLLAMWQMRLMRFRRTPRHDQNVVLQHEVAHVLEADAVLVSG